MSDPYIGEIRMFGGNFAPAGWAFCDGQLMPISENETLFNLIGTTYGGDGQATFALPNLQSRVPIHAGTGPTGINYILGEMLGEESVTLTVNQIHIHTHAMGATTNAGDQAGPNGQLTATAPINVYHAPTSDFKQLNPQAVSLTGGSQPHENCQPFLCVNFILSLFGIFPTQS